MYKVAYSSFIDQSDWARVHSTENVEFICGLDWRNPEKFSSTLAECDLAILRFDAYWNLKMLSETPREHLKALLRKDLKVAVWSEDSHHVAHLEAELSPVFDRMFTAHSQYMHLLPPEKVGWIPTSFNSFSISELFSALDKPQPSSFKRKLIFPFRRYPDELTTRNQIADQIQEYCDSKGISALIGEVGAGHQDQEKETCNEILSSHGVLNLSLREEMNQRVFTALALNKPMLCDRVADLENVDADFSATTFLNRDLSNLEEAIDQFLNTDSRAVQTSQSVAEKHMHVHRVVEMINSCLETELEVEVPELDYSCVPKTPTPPLVSSAPYEPYKVEAGSSAVSEPKGIKGFLRAIKRKIRKPKPKPIHPHSPENFRKVVEEFVNLPS